MYLVGFHYRNVFTCQFVGAQPSVMTNTKLQDIISALNKYVCTKTKLIMVFCSVMRTFCHFEEAVQDLYCSYT